MMTSYFNLLKYAATGIASPDMTYFDKMRAYTLMGGATVQTLTGQPPLTFKADGTPISWSMKGNGQQTGTPTPDAPITPTFCGVRTGNLFDLNATDTTNGYVNGAYLLSDGSENESAQYRISEYIEIQSGTAYTLVYANSLNNPSLCFYDSSKQYISGQKYGNNRTVTVTSPSNAKYIRISYTYTVRKSVMLNLGSTALPYEPYGWAVKITCAGQTVPVYLGQVSTVRRVRKLVLTGEEEGWGRYKQGDNLAYMYLDLYNSPNMAVLDTGICTHLEQRIITSGNSNEGFGIQNLSSNTKTSLLIRNSDMGMSSVDAFKTYLAQQYAAGTPVCVWYVLATPETGITNEPLAKIGTYADELHSEDAAVTIPTVNGSNTLTVDTELQPSEMSITFKG